MSRTNVRESLAGEKWGAGLLSNVWPAVFKARLLEPWNEAAKGMAGEVALCRLTASMTLSVHWHQLVKAMRKGVAFGSGVGTWDRQ